MSNLDVPFNVSKISSYFILITSTTTLSLFYGIWQLCQNVLPKMDLDHCFSMWLQDANFKFKYELLDEHLPESLAVGIEAYQLPMPAYDINNECVAEITRPIANALLMGASLGGAVAVLFCIINNYHKFKQPCFSQLGSIDANSDNLKDEKEQDATRTPFSPV